MTLSQRLTERFTPFTVTGMAVAIVLTVAIPVLQADRVNIGIS
ncbi:MAG: hypothetical protein ABSF89_05250 [Acidimicrobiales bacterium]